MLNLNGVEIEVTLFPDGTSQVWKLPEAAIKGDEHTIVWEFASEAEFLHLAQLRALLRGRVKLDVRYLPYARQDKPVANDATFALRPFAHLLNALNFDEITILDPHSQVATEHIHRSQAVYPMEQVALVVQKTQADLLCYPDKGARTRYGAIYPYASIHGEKVRDQQTGKITSYQLVGEAAGKHVLIVDDICDGGATFVALAHELRKAGAASINLFVTHGIFSRGLGPMVEAGIKRVFTAKGKVSMIHGPELVTYEELKK